MHDCIWRRASVAGVTSGEEADDGRAILELCLIVEAC